MVLEENQQLVPSQETSSADEERILCIVRDLTDAANCHKQTVNLPASTPISVVQRELSKICGYVADSVSCRYENQGSEVVLDQLEECPLSAVCPLGLKRYNFTIQEREDVTPQKLETVDTSGYDSQASSSKSYHSSYGDNTYSSNSYSDYGSYSYSTALIKSETGYIGLVNQAMTCYLNSLLQTLFMTPEFRNAIYRWEFDGTEEDAVKSIPYHLQRLFLQLQMSKKRAVETTDLTKSFGWDSSEVWQQHDVQELCRVMFDALEQKWKNTDQANLINQLYQGKLKDYVKCLECGYESARTDAYLDIPLVIRPFGSTEAYGSVEEAMEAFVQPETLDGTNQYFCERCNKKCDAHKGLRFVTFPYLLTLQLKRFDFDYSTMHRIKLNDRMTFPEILNLNRFIEEDYMAADGETANNLDDGDDVDEGIVLENGASGASSSCDSASNSSSEAATNDKNARESAVKGPYVYERFSIMVHSGSAAGGHYYAYIKSFKDGQWYSFNDQQVSRITYDDIRKTYGGSNFARGFYSSTYASSANAYMLMYRQIDKEENADFMQPEDFPNSLKLEWQKLLMKEETEKKQRELDKSTCKIKLYCIHPTLDRKMEMKFEIHKDITLREATEVAYKLCDLEKEIPLDCCRLVKYDEYSDSMEKSFEGDEDTLMGVVLGGVKASYNFDLLLETRKPDQQFQEYKPGGVTIKMYIVDIHKETINGPFSIRAYHVQTVSEFMSLVAKQLGLPDTQTMRCVLERFHNDLRPLVNLHKTLKAEGFFKSNKVYVECSSDETDCQVPFLQSKFYELLDRHQNTIRVHVTLPSRDEVAEYLQSQHRHQQLLRTLCHQEFEQALERDEGIEDSVVDLKELSLGGEPIASSPNWGPEEEMGCMDAGFISGELSGPCSDASPGALPFKYSPSCQDVSVSAEFDLVDPNLHSLQSGEPYSEFNLDSVGHPSPGRDSRPLSNASMEASMGDFSDSNQSARSRPFSTCSLEAVVGDSCDYSGSLEINATDSCDSGKTSRPISSGSMETNPGESFESFHTCSLLCNPTENMTGSQTLYISNQSAQCNESTFAEGSCEAGCYELQSNVLIAPVSSEPFRPSSPNLRTLCNADGTSDSLQVNSCLLEDSGSHTVGTFWGSVNSEDPGIPSLMESNPSDKGSATYMSPEAENWDMEIGETAEMASQSPPVDAEEDTKVDVKRYFNAVYCDPVVSDSELRTLLVSVDKRITLGAFKKELEEFVGTCSENFKVYRVYSNNQEFESIRLSDSLSFLEDGKLNIKMGRALRPGEHRIKVYQLLVNEPEPCKFLIETIFAKGMTVLESKKLILPEIREQCGLNIPLDRCRFRKKTWKNPGTVYIDSQVYDDEIALFPNWEVFLEVLDAPEQMTAISQLAIFVRRWRPFTYELDPFQEIVLSHQSVEELKHKISCISDLPVENVEFAKGKGTFPCEMSVLEIHTDLDWNPQVAMLNVWPLYICDDGHVIFYRDKLEELGELSEERKKEIQQKENVRINKVAQKLTYSPRKERALKIYTDDSPPASSQSSYADVD